MSDFDFDWSWFEDGSDNETQELYVVKAPTAATLTLAAELEIAFDEVHHYTATEFRHNMGDFEFRRRMQFRANAKRDGVRYGDYITKKKLD